MLGKRIKVEGKKTREGRKVKKQSQNRRRGRKKEKEDWENIEIRQRNDIEKLRKKLEETQEQSLKDQVRCI